MNLYFLGITGIIWLTIGIYIRFGGLKALFLMPSVPLIIPEALRNMFIPMGITFIVFELILSDLFPDIRTRQDLFSWVLMPMFFVSLILGVVSPRWLRPRWLVFLEDEYGTVTRKLFNEARKDVDAWIKQVRTQAGLEKWAAETCHELGYPPLPGRIEKRAKKRKR